MVIFTTRVKILQCREVAGLGENFIEQKFSSVHYSNYTCTHTHTQMPRVSNSPYWSWSGVSSGNIQQPHRRERRSQHVSIPEPNPRPTGQTPEPAVLLLHGHSGGRLPTSQEAWQVGRGDPGLWGSGGARGGRGDKRVCGRSRLLHCNNTTVQGRWESIMHENDL